jgi:hypothetical protein
MAMICDGVCNLGVKTIHRQVLDTVENLRKKWEAY